ERSASTDHEDVLIKGEQLVQKAKADHFIHGVVAAHVFPQHEQFSFRVENGGGVHSAGLRERFLCTVQERGQAAQNLCGHDRSRFDGGKVLVDRIDGGFAAEAAARRGEDVARELIEVDLY